MHASRAHMCSKHIRLQSADQHVGGRRCIGGSRRRQLPGVYPWEVASSELRGAVASTSAMPVALQCHRPPHQRHLHVQVWLRCEFCPFSSTVLTYPYHSPLHTKSLS